LLFAIHNKIQFIDRARNGSFQPGKSFAFPEGFNCEAVEQQGEHQTRGTGKNATL
jgi:hypothetical protein